MTLRPLDPYEPEAKDPAVTELIDFIRARLDEDERTAHEARRGPWHVDGGTVYATHITDQIVDYTDSAEHVARHDPARVLAEVDAKRKMIALCGPPLIDVTPFGTAPDAPPETVLGAGEPWGLPVLHLLALPYADHPDYRAEWRP